ncbi:hypothetical protein GCM10023199_20290 [Actinomycetospora chibensis]
MVGIETVADTGSLRVGVDVGTERTASHGGATFRVRAGLPARTCGDADQGRQERVGSGTPA